MTDWTGLIAAFATGLLGSSHCVAMCGGIASALQLAAPRHWPRVLAGGVYALGRISSYVVLAGVLSWFSLTALDLAEAQWALSLFRLLGALLLVMMAGYIGRWWLGLRWLEERGQALFQPLQAMFRRWLPIRKGWQVFAAGALWGFLPCGLVYTGVAYAITAEQTSQAVLRMAAFGLGTLPAVLVTGLAAETLGRWLRLQAVRRMASALLLLLAAWTLYPLSHQWSGSAMQHHDAHVLHGP
jgi:hypothetical protein